MPEKSILIVTPFFAPQSHAAVYRAHKLAKYLPQYGWTPHVVTIETNYVFNEDPGLLRELPEQVKIHRARYIEPTVRGLRMALGGADRTFATLASPAVAKPVAAASKTQPGAGIYQYILDRWIQTPDSYWTWVGPAIRLARQLIAKHDIRVIYTTSPPYSSNLVGLALRDAGCQWVADLRDPLAYGKLSSTYGAVAAMQRQILEQTLRRADVVTGAAEAFRLILNDMFLEVKQDYRFIPTGLDEALLPPPSETPQRPWPYLIFAGEFLPEYDDYFLDAFSLALRDPEVRATGVRVLVVGHQILNPARLMPRLLKHSLESFFEFVPHLPQRELYTLIQGAIGGLFFPGHAVRWWCHPAKMVDFLALRKPVVAVVPDPSEARSALSRSGLGVFLDGTVANAAARLVSFLRDPSSQRVTDDEVCAEHTSSRQVEAFVAIFEQLNR